MSLEKCQSALNMGAQIVGGLSKTINSIGSVVESAGRQYCKLLCNQENTLKRIALISLAEFATFTSLLSTSKDFEFDGNFALPLLFFATVNTKIALFGSTNNAGM